MQTVVLQSYRNTDVPYWMNRCMESTQQWALAEGWEYECIGDEFFELAPKWVQQRCHKNIYAITDICRLQWLSDKLLDGYERVIWVDADVLVFEPEYLDLASCKNFAFAHELFLRVSRDSRISPTHGINNAFMLFEREQTILDMYLNTCLEKIRQLPNGEVPRTLLGPSMLMEFNKSLTLNLLNGVGLFTLAIMQDIITENKSLVQEYKRHSPTKVGAANLCHFLRNYCPPHDRPNFDHLYNRAVDQLLETKGASFN